MATRHVRTTMKAAVLALALCGATFASSKVPSDYTRFVTQFPDLAQPLEAGDFRHPAETELIDTLTSANPGIRDLIENVKKDQLRQVRDKDQLHRLHAVEVTATQHPDVHRLAREAAAALALHSDFKVFILSNPEMIDDIFGIPRHGHYGNSFGPYTILLTSGMVRALTADELKFVVGREMGHVKANHRFYTALAFEYQRVAGKLPRIFPEDRTTKAPGLGGLLTFFFQRAPAPSRISEFSADRAGLVAVQRRDIAIATLAKLARGDLEGMPGFDLASYLRQVESAANDLTPNDLADLVGGDGYLPYVLNRVSEASRFGQSEQYKALIDRLTVNPFLMEAETLYTIGTSLAQWSKRLAEFNAAPGTANLDPLERAVILADLASKVDRRQRAVTELEALVLDHVESLGLANDNTRFADLVATARRRGDARPFKAAFARLLDQIQYALQQPGVPETQIQSLEAKKAAIDAVKDLAPKPHPRPTSLPPQWLEASDLPALLDSTVASLRDAAANSTREEFFVQLETLKPQLKAAAVKLVLSLPADRARELAELVGAQGGPIARAVAECMAARTNPTSLEALFDRHFDRARDLMKTVPLFMIRRALTRYAGLDV